MPSTVTPDAAVRAGVAPWSTPQSTPRPLGYARPGQRQHCLAAAGLSTTLARAQGFPCAVMRFRRPTLLYGRRSERRVLDGLLERAREGGSGVLVLTGEAGVGKTALLEYAAESAADLRVVRAAGVESEMELAFAGLHQLCSPLLDLVGRLPPPQRTALSTAFGLESGPAPDRFLAGLAVLSLLAEAAEQQPVLCLVDDAQWLDRASAQALAFAARRLRAESVLVLLAVREPHTDFDGLPDMLIEGLPDADARDLLASVVPWPVDERVRQQIVAETRGNPLALLELPRGLSPAQLAGGFGAPDLLPLSSRIEESFLRRVESLPAETRLLLQVAAAEPGGDPALVRRAAKQLGLRVEIAGMAEAAGLLQIGGRVVFRHPLVRSAVYRAASPGERRKVHAALAEATDPQADPDRRAWHRALATSGTDEDIAAQLERCAGRAQARGGLAAAAAFLERAATLTPDPGRAAERALAAAQAKHLAGAPEAALGLLAAAEAGPLDELMRARAEVLRAQIAYSTERGSGAARLLLRAARRLEALDAGLARETYLDALWAARFSGRLEHGGGVLEVAQAALAAPAPPGPPRASDLLLDGLATLFTKGYAAGAPKLKEAVHAFRGQDSSGQEGLRWLWLASQAAVIVMDHESWTVLADRQLELARGSGALAVLPVALTMRATAHTLAGELADAARLNDEMRALAEAIGSYVPPYGPVVFAAWQGRAEEGQAVIDETLRTAAARGEIQGVAAAHWARAVLSNALGRYTEAATAATLASDHPEGLGFSNTSLVELIEAAARTGQAENAADASRLFTERATASGCDWALGDAARSRALLSRGESAERLYREAIDRLSRARVRAELARAHLVYGEWLRREKRRGDARDQLRTAYQMLTAMGIEGFAERARRELVATGETVRRRTVETASDLTAQEGQIAKLAAEGWSNPEIGAKLFLSAKTVEWHLSKVFAKLGISSRRQLRDALTARPPR
jgi:DNA-binding CsgD family transcriptional regulator